MEALKSLNAFFRISFRIGYFIGLAALLVSYLAPYANPKEFWLIAYFGLAYPWLLLLNILFLIWWIVRWNRLYWVSMIAILAGWNNMRLLFHFGEEEPGKNGIEVMSFNVRNFNLYDWAGNPGIRDSIYHFLEKEQPDILCLQEFYHGDSSEYATIDTLMHFTGAAGRHVVYTHNKNRRKHWGIATYSRHPIIRKGKVPFKYKSNNICIWSDIKIGEDTVRVYNMHLQSIRFDQADRRFIEALKENNDTLDAEDIEINSKNILRRIKRAFIKRTTQTEKILAHMDSCRYKKIICGDFNDTPYSYTYQLFSEKYQDAFMQGGRGIGATYPGLLPYRIDYIFHSMEDPARGFRVFKKELSDHYPISCRIKIN